MEEVKKLIDRFNLQPHPEGGYYASTYRSTLEIPKEALPKGFGGVRPVSSAIYFLLEKNNFSAFHRIQSDECWHFYEGDSLGLHCLSPTGIYRFIKLGRGPQCLYQYVVPAGDWFAAEPMPESSYSFVGCTVSPGFDFEEWELAKRSQLLQAFPSYHELIHRLTR